MSDQQSVAVGWQDVAEHWEKAYREAIARAERAEKRMADFTLKVLEFKDRTKAAESELAEVLGHADRFEARAESAEALLEEARRLVRRLYAQVWLTVAGEDWSMRSDSDAFLAKLEKREGKE